MKRFGATVALASLALFGACGGQHHSQQAQPLNQQAQQLNRATLTAAVNDYLAQRGHLCLAKYDWPITISAAGQQARGLDAQQMLVLEALGLVKGSDASATPEATRPAREYTLTEAGQKYYLHVPVVITAANLHVTHPADFCVAALSLDRLVGWEKPMQLDNRTMTSVLFTYKIAPAPWTQTPDARRVFPVVTHAVENAGTQQLRLALHLAPSGWIADELSE